ncbi:MAG: hypothetical protein JWP55_4846 [Mycobacterium sp.]|nr:hypothetical protein [Mycobacterium sp.]
MSGGVWLRGSAGCVATGVGARRARGLGAGCAARARGASRTASGRTAGRRGFTRLAGLCLCRRSCRCHRSAWWWCPTSCPIPASSRAWWKASQAPSRWPPLLRPLIPQVSRPFRRPAWVATDNAADDSADGLVSATFVARSVDVAAAIADRAQQVAGFQGIDDGLYLKRGRLEGAVDRADGTQTQTKQSLRDLRDDVRDVLHHRDRDLKQVEQREDRADDESEPGTERRV